MATSKKPYHHGDLSRQLIAVGEAVLAERGLAGLSLREVARRLGVSHNAPFKHFASREALLAAMAEAGFEELGQRLAAADAGPPEKYVVARGLAYVGFALERPTLFRLMFSGEIDMDRFPELAQRAEWSLGAVGGRIADAFGSEAIADATLSAWAFVHGLSHLLLDGQIPPEMRAGRSDQELARGVVAAMAHGLGLPPA